MNPNSPYQPPKSNVSQKADSDKYVKYFFFELKLKTYYLMQTFIFIFLAIVAVILYFALADIDGFVSYAWAVPVVIIILETIETIFISKSKTFTKD